MPGLPRRVFSGTNDMVKKLTGREPLEMMDYIVKNEALFRAPVAAHDIHLGHMKASSLLDCWLYFRTQSLSSGMISRSVN
ncbi:hypothetical protein HDF11_004891 [Tunturiibacter psychrotolerans]|jgi:hypothetical protein